MFYSAFPIPPLRNKGKKGAHAWTPSAAGIESFRSVTTKDNIHYELVEVK